MFCRVLPVRLFVCRHDTFPKILVGFRLNFIFVVYTKLRVPHLVLIYTDLMLLNNCRCRTQWPRGLRRGSAAARLLGLWVRIPLGAWMCVCCECCVLSGRGLCDELITRPEESDRLWFVVVCDLDTSRVRRTNGAFAPKKKREQ